MHLAKRRRIYTSVHHLIPRSRARECGVDAYDPRNEVKIDHRMHSAWHEVFENALPHEVAIHLALLLRAGITTYSGFKSEAFRITFNTLDVKKALGDVWVYWTPPREFYDPEIPPFLAYRLRPSLVSTSHSNGNVVAFKR